jgi:hypothetical protein
VNGNELATLENAGNSQGREKRRVWGWTNSDGGCGVTEKETEMLRIAVFSALVLFAAPVLADDMKCDDATMADMNSKVSAMTDAKAQKTAMKEMKMADAAMKKKNMKSCAMHMNKAMKGTM